MKTLSEALLGDVGCTVLLIYPDGQVTGRLENVSVERDIIWSQDLSTTEPEETPGRTFVTIRMVVYSGVKIQG